MPFICVDYIMSFAFPSSVVPIIGDGRLAGDVDEPVGRMLLSFLYPGVLPVQLAQGSNDQVADQVRPLLFVGLVAELNLHPVHLQTSARSSGRSQKCALWRPGEQAPHGCRT